MRKNYFKNYLKIRTHQQEGNFLKQAEVTGGEKRKNERKRKLLDTSHEA